MYDTPIAKQPPRTAWTLVLAGLGRSWPPWMSWSSRRRCPPCSTSSGPALPTVANQVTGSVPAADVGVAAGTNNALNALGGVFGIAILAAIFAAHGSYATHATFIDGFRPAEWAAAGASAIGVIAAALTPSKSADADRLTPAPEPAPVRQPA